ncbi:hypothetical protein FB45DRAFT_980994 [Roridomyces roridus]|uniref:SWIM-type domain-containing protein n=1 Tax=Roridomyces roridus TaxID=1738132 RepID=A0AAD7BFA6_9AGAR|nr:hypothetical protein FB45DRAFT_980994 [Roridomyces roridus]
MYIFCHQRGLREVWAYMWTAWYRPEKYKLWARSTQPERIGHWRTNMGLENFFRYLKHDTLRFLLHPRLDQVIFLVVTEVLPTFIAKMQIFDPAYRPGRAPELTPFQVAFKRNWKKLSERALGSHTYDTDVSRWTCNCGQQKYNPYILCKHLVQAVAPPPPHFFTEVVRRRVIPFYYHPSLTLKDGSELPEPDITRSVSNGDSIQLITPDLNAAAPAQRGSKRKRRAEPLLTTPPPIPSSVQPHADSDAMEEDTEMAETREWLNERLTKLKAGVAVLQRQLENPVPSPIWLKSMRRANIGKDLAEMAQDVRHFTETGRGERSTTWARKGDKDSGRYTRNTMGYID